MDCNQLYAKLFRPVEEQLGPMDAHTLAAIIGFDLGGPLALSTVGRERRERFVTTSYVNSLSVMTKRLETLGGTN